MCRNVDDCFLHISPSRLYPALRSHRVDIFVLSSAMSSKNVDKSPGPPGDLEEASPANDAATGLSAPAIVVTPPPSPRILSSEGVPEQEPTVPAAAGTRPRSDPPQSTPVQVLVISDMAQDCWELFRHLLERMGTKAPITQRLVTEYQQRYDSWIGFLGVFAQENLNLDHRLRNSPEVKSLVTQQLHIVKKNLNAGMLANHPILAWLAENPRVRTVLRGDHLQRSSWSA